MENLLETLYVDPTESSSSNEEFAERARIERCIQLLHQPSHREEALTLLNKERRSKDMPLLLWNSENVSFILLQEFLMVYTLLSSPSLGMKEVTRVCNAMALLQSMASHSETKMKIVKANLPVYVYPFLNTTENKIKQYDYLRLSSLGVIGALVKVEDTNTPEVIHFLLETEVFPLCIQCIEVGGELAKTVAAFVVSKILTYEEGQLYCSTFPDRFYAALHVLAKSVEQFSGKPPTLLLKHILMCFMRLSEMPRFCDVLTVYYPARLRDPAYLNFACEDVLVRRLAHQVLQNVTSGIGPSPTFASRMLPFH